MREMRRKSGNNNKKHLHLRHHVNPENPRVEIHRQSFILILFVSIITNELL